MSDIRQGEDRSIEECLTNDFLVTAARTWSHEEFLNAVHLWSNTCPAQSLRGKLVAIPGEYTLEALSFLVYARLSNQFSVTCIGWDPQVREPLLNSLQPDRIWQGSASHWQGWIENAQPHRYPLMEKLCGNTGLILATTGTTGQRKWVLHSLLDFSNRYAQRTAKPVRVLPLMSPSHVGGQDIFWRAWFAKATLVIPDEWTPEGVGRTVQAHQVEFLAATPSYLRGLWIRGIFSHYDWRSVKRVTYGGERMPAALLEELRKQLPWVQWEQRYGLSELSTFSTSDAGDGYLRISEHSPEWKVVAGELWVKRPRSWLGYLSDTVPGDEWFATGDQVDLREDGALRILGRKGLFINVGGEKVSPEEVESVIYEIPGVRECRVYPHADALMGQVVAAELAVDESLQQHNWRLEVRKWCRQKLPLAAVPVHVKLTDSGQTKWQLKQQR